MTVEQILPQRFPFLLVDRVEEQRSGEFARVKKCVSIGEPIFAGHFPDRPIYPAAYLLEFMSQAAQVMAFRPDQDKSAVAVTVKVDDFRISRPVSPGDELFAEATLEEVKGPFWITNVKVTNQRNEMVTRCVLTGQFL